MDSDALALSASLISPAYVKQAESALLKRRKLIKGLLSQRRLPEQGWDEASIEQLVQASFGLQTEVHCCNRLNRVL